MLINFKQINLYISSSQTKKVVVQHFTRHNGPLHSHCVPQQYPRATAQHYTINTTRLDVISTNQIPYANKLKSTIPANLNFMPARRWCSRVALPATNTNNVYFIK